jgi:hypothetical protein
MGGRSAGGNIPPGAETGIKQPHRAQTIEGLGINCQTLRLADHGAIPFKTQPAEVIDYAIDEVFAAAARIDILDPQQEASAALTREIMCQHR